MFVQPLLQWKSNEYYTNWVCICSLGYTACNAHGPYCHLWTALLYNIFPHYHINGTTLGITLMNTKFVFWFSVQLLPETFLILRWTERDIIQNVYRSSCKVTVIIARFWWYLNFLDRFSKNPQISNFMKIRPVGGELFHADGQTYKHGDANSHFSQFCEST